MEHESRPALHLPGDLVAYFALTFAISWAIEVPLALQAQGLLRRVVPLWLHYAASFGPLLAAVSVVLATRGPSGVGRLFSGLVCWRARPIYWIVAVIAPCTVFALLVLVTRLTKGAWSDLALLGRPDYLPAIGMLPTLLLWVLTFGVTTLPAEAGEHLGQRSPQSATLAPNGCVPAGFSTAPWGEHSEQHSRRGPGQDRSQDRHAPER